MLKTLRGDESVDARRTRFFRTAKIVSAGFLIGSLFAVARLGWALRTRATWTDYRSVAITPAQMYRDIVFFLVVAAVALVIFLCLRRRALQ
jgi:hypothetical protein